VNIRNFSIIAHIDHGKSTLADRMLELTATVDARLMQDQVLDSMELERERGITIKMTPVRMLFKSKSGKDFIFNLIDTPGHIDFSYEVSRSLRAVEGAILLVDATQGVQAQTMTVLEMAKEAGLRIIPVVNKIDSPLAKVDDTKEEIMKILGCEYEDIYAVSGKTGEGVMELFEVIAREIPEPKKVNLDINGSRALIFDFEYSNHQGVILYIRMLDGQVKKNDEFVFLQSKAKFIVREVGYFRPQKVENDRLSEGEIGYVVTGIKEPGVARVGDTITPFAHQMEAFPGYSEPTPLVFASVYPEFQEYFDDLRTALGKLRLSDSSLTYEEESSGALGRGFRAGFLGMLHLEIVTERLRREFGLSLVVTSPSITYEVTTRDGKTEMVYTPIHFPDHGEVVSVKEPWILTTIITPHTYISNVMEILHKHEASVLELEDWGFDRVRMTLDMPLRELMRNFFDEIKSVTSGYASVAYETGEMRPASVTRLDVYVAEERVAAFSKVIPEYRSQEESEEVVEKLEKILPKEMFRVKIQAYIKGRIVASRSIAPMKKDVTGHLYGGDITRKMKLREKQKEGKKRMLAEGKVHISHDTFLKMMK
jgi:GTP-binding protein LepA